MKTLVVCSDCYTLNRVDLEKAATAKPVCANCKSYLPIHDGVQDINGASLKKLLSNSTLPIVVDFWAEWCAPCKMFAPIFKSVAKTMGEKIIFAKLNTEEDSEASSIYRIQAIPTLVVFKNGIEVDRQSGVMQASVLSSYLSKFVK